MDRKKEALEYLQKGFEWNPTVADFARGHGQIALELGLKDVALASYKSAITVAPTRGSLHFGLANVQFETDMLEDAVASYRRAIQLVPTFADAYNNLGNALRTLGRFDEAVDGENNFTQKAFHLVS